MKVYIIDNNNIFNRAEEIDPMGAIPNGAVMVKPPILKSSQFAKWNACAWEILDSYPDIVPSPVQIPQTITKLQAMKQLKVINKWDTMKAMLAQNEEINDEWMLSDNLNRSYPLVLKMAKGMGFNDEELDIFFIEADKLL
jgi:hypothetical protein